MAVTRNVNEIILNLIDFFRLVQPDLDTKPGTVSRDLFIDAPSSQLALLYDQLSSVANSQSFRLVVGTDLDNLAKNFGLVRKQATPTTGVALLTFAAINAPVPINVGNTIIANNGFAYAVSSGISVNPNNANFYRSVASKFADQLSLVGISDPFAVEVTVIATTAGTAGNIGAFSLSRTTIPSVSNVTNINTFTGGTDQENDAAFRTRILAAFSGSSIGTELGYLNAALGTTGVSDAFVVKPGDPLMTRDGTEVKTNADGSLSIISEGSGGKVDVVVLGSNLVQNIDTFIYQDKSNNNDPTNSKNNIVLGQITADANKTINQKRISDIASGKLPAQPVEEILAVTGSVSGGNFAPMTVDSFGRVSGNYQLLKDMGVYSGSPFGFDTFHWISNKISGFNEARIKGQYNGQDTATFTDVLVIPQVRQTFGITNENSIVTIDRSIIQLLHTPATNVTRVFNVNTGERYLITNQNLDNTGTFNTSGRIQISGNTLPVPSDGLQVDYNWIINYDPYSDYDGLINTNNARTVNDNIDWGLANEIRQERVAFNDNTDPNFFQGIASHPIDTIISVNKFTEIDGQVGTVSSGIYINRLAVVLNNLANATITVDSITWKNTNVELFKTAQSDSNISNATEVVGIQILYNTTIILPSDTVAKDGDHITAVINSIDVFHSSTTQGSSSGDQITIPTSLINTTAHHIILSVFYIANVSDLFSSATTSLPSSRIGNGFSLNNNNGFNNFSPVNLSRREHQIVQLNLSNQFFIELNLSSNEYDLTVDQIISVVRLSDGHEIWSHTHPGIITIGTSGNYQLIFSGFNSPNSGERVLAIYYATDIRRFQPFSYSNALIKTRTDILTQDPAGSGKLMVPLNSISSQSSGVTFEIVESNSDVMLFSVTDGYIISNNDGTAIITSASTNFSTLADLTNKKINITGSTLLGSTNDNNNGIYDIVSYDAATNNIVITEVLNKITSDQVSIIRLLDGQEVFNYTGIIDVAHNKILLPISPNVKLGDHVFVIFFKYRNLRKAPTRLVSAISDQITNTGTLIINGTTLGLAQDIIFTATNTGLKLNMAEALRKALNLSSINTIPNNINLARVLKLEKVITASPTDDTVLEILTTYDTKNTTIQNNLLFSDDMLANPILQSTDFILPNTSNNSLNIQTHNLPALGDKIRISFYYAVSNDQENLIYTRNGSLYTNKKFALINRTFVASGFRASQSTKLTLTSFTQPSSGARYTATYDYLAPKQNERINITSNYNKLVSDATFNIEASRPITADVLAREAKLVQLDLTINVVIDPTMLSLTTTILQNLRNQLNNALTTSKLGQIIDQVTLNNVAKSVSGIDRSRILYFNISGKTGSILTFKAHNDQFFEPHTITINTEVR